MYFASCFLLSAALVEVVWKFYDVGTNWKGNMGHVLFDR